VYITSTTASPLVVLSSVQLLENTANDIGAAVYFYGLHVFVEYSIIKDNAVLRRLLRSLTIIGGYCFATC
jgi:hypothetical protein